MVDNSVFIGLSKAVIIVLILHFILKRLISARPTLVPKIQAVTTVAPPTAATKPNSDISVKDINDRLRDFVDEIDDDSSDDEDGPTGYDAQVPGLLGDKNYTAYRAVNDVQDLKNLVATGVNAGPPDPVASRAISAPASSSEPVCTGGPLMDGVYGYNFDSPGAGYSLVEAPPVTVAVTNGVLP